VSEKYEGTREVTTTMGLKVTVEYPEYLDLQRQGLIKEKEAKTDGRVSK
jgi:hypothetical protein